MLQRPSQPQPTPPPSHPSPPLPKKACVAGDPHSLPCSHKLSKAARKKELRAESGAEPPQAPRAFVLPDGASASELSSELLFLREELLAKQEEERTRLAAAAQQLQQPLRDDVQVLYDEAMELMSE